MDGFREVWGGQLGGENRFLKVFFDVFFEVDVGIDFFGVLARFWSVWEAKLGGKMEPRSMQKGIEKTMEKERGWVRPGGSRVYPFPN